MKSVCIIVWMFFSSLVYFGVHAQMDSRVRHWGKEHGLESTIIYHIYQDKNNLIWISTYAGLYYFDGFRAYPSPIKVGKEGLPFQGIVSNLFQKSNGKYFIVADGMLGEYDPFNHIFRPFEKEITIHPAFGFRELEGRVYIWNDISKTYLLDEKNEDIVPMRFVSEEGKLLSERVVFSLNPDRFCCMSFLEGKPVWVESGKKFGEYVISNNPLPFDHAWNQEGYFFYRRDGFGNHWYRHLLSFEWRILDPSKKKEITKEILSNFGSVTVYYIIPSENLTKYDTSDGIYLWENTSEKPFKLLSDNPKMSGAEIFWTFDRGLSFWTKTNAGFFHQSLELNPFSNLTIEKGLFDNMIIGVYPLDSMRMIIHHGFTAENFTVFDKITKKTRQVSVDDLVLEFGLLPDFKYSNGLYSWIEEFGTKIENISGSNLNRNIWTNHLFIHDGNAFEFAIFPAADPEKFLQLRRISDDRLIFPKVEPIQLANQGDTVWIGTDAQGLLALHTPSGNVRQWLPDADLEGSIPANRVYAIIPVANGNLWLGTAKGLSYFDKANERFTTFNTTDGLANNRIYSMTFDLNGALWIGTGNGLSRFDTLSKTFTNYFKADGLVNQEFNRNSAVVLNDGMVLMGGMDGLDYFYPDQINIDRDIPRPFIAHVTNNNSLVNLRKQQSFRNDQDHFSFYISALPIWKASELAYQYRMIGANEDWQDLNYSNIVHFPNLPPGSYSFQVKIANQPEIASYDFVIHQVWYASWWFRLTFILFGLFLIYLIYRMMLVRRIYRFQQENKIIQMKAEQALSVTKERERIIADLHDDVGATLSSLHIYGDLAGKVWDSQPEKGKEMVDKIRDQSKELMGRMSDIVWSMKDPKNEKYSLRSRIRNYANELLSSREILFADVLASDLDEKIVQPELRRNLLLVVKEAMNNIAKHSHATRVRLMLYEKDGQLILKINDNGSGLDLLKAQKGNGLGNMEKRCKQMNGTLSIASQNGSGTTLTCSIPMATFSIGDGTESP